MIDWKKAAGLVAAVAMVAGLWICFAPGDNDNSTSYMERIVAGTAAGGRKAQSEKHVYYRDKAVVLIYHDFGQPETGTRISPARFRSHLEMLKDKGFNVVGLGQVTRFLDGKDSLPPNAVALTIDDGAVSAYKVAWPILQEYGFPATVFVVAGRVGSSISARAGSPWLTWEQMREMCCRGVTFEAHTFNSHYYTVDYLGHKSACLVARLPGESQSHFEERILEDLRFSRDLMGKNLQVPVDCFAAPYGVYDDTTKKLAKAAGYRYLFSTRHSAVERRTSPFDLGRISVGIKGTDADKVLAEILAVTGEQSEQQDE